MSMHSERSLKKIRIVAKVVITFLILICEVLVFFAVASELCVPMPSPSPEYVSLEEEYIDAILLYINEGKIEVPEGTVLSVSDTSVTLTHVASKVCSTCRFTSKGVPIFSWHSTNYAFDYFVACLVALFLLLPIWFLITLIACFILPGNTLFATADTDKS